MATLEPQDLKNIYTALPEDLRTAIFSPETTEVYNQIQGRYALDSAQREELSIQSGLLMMGITEPKEYVVVLSEKLGIPRDKAAFIAQEVNRNILHDVRESLKMIHQPETETPPQEIQEEPSVPAAMPYATMPPIPPTPVPMPSLPPSPVTSSLDQKLGSTFRVPTPPQAGVPNYSVPTPPVPPPMAPAPSPTLVVPPPPVPPTPPSPSTPRAGDPYREAVL